MGALHLFVGSGLVRFMDVILLLCQMSLKIDPGESPRETDHERRAEYGYASID